MTSFTAAVKFFFFALICIVLVPPQWLILRFTKGPASYVLPRLWHGLACRIFNIRIETDGQPYTASQVLYVSNHVSYLDIPVLGSIIPNASFVSKNDVRTWPVWGFLSGLQQTAFISRARKDTKAEAQSLDAMIENGKNLIIFPEGTSTDGLGVKDFKSSLFSLALKNTDHPLMIQPVTIKILTTNGSPPQTADERNIYAWPLELEVALHEHLWGTAKSSGAVLRIRFHDVIQSSAFKDRKTLAKTCHEAVCRGLNNAKAA